MVCSVCPIGNEILVTGSGIASDLFSNKAIFNGNSKLSGNFSHFSSASFSYHWSCLESMQEFCLIEIFEEHT